QLLQRKQRLWRERQRPNLLQISMGQTKRFDHAWNLFCEIAALGLLHRPSFAQGDCRPARPLPERRLRLDIRKDASRHTDKQRVEVGCSGRWRARRVTIYLA